MGKWRNARAKRAKGRLLSAYFQNLRAHPPDVLIGANINLSDGIRNHMIGIREHSALKVSLSPPDELLASLNYHDFHTTFRREVMELDPSGSRVIHSHVYPYFIEWCLRHRDSGALWVHTYHLPYFPVGESTDLEPWQHEINQALINDASRAHVRLSVSLWQREYLLREFGISSEYVPNGVDVAFCDAANARAFSEKWQLGAFVLYVGRDDPVKNPREFVQLARRLPGETFVMIGTGLDEAWLESEFPTDAPSNIRMHGAATRTDVQNALAACSLLVVTSWREGLPTLVLEAMTHQRAIVVSDDPGCREAVSEGRFGLVYKRGDIDDLVAKTTEALSSVGGKPGARQRILEHYDWRVVGAQMDEIYCRPIP